MNIGQIVLRLTHVVRPTLLVFGLTSAGPALAAGSTPSTGAVASQKVLASDTTPGRLQAYRDAARSAIAAQSIVEDRRTALSALRALTDSQVASMFPTGGYAEALALADAALGFAQDAATAAEERSASSLLVLTAGRTLDSDAMARLHALLGL